MPQKARPKLPKLSGKLKVDIPALRPEAAQPPVNLDDKVNVMVDGKEYVIKAEDLVKIKELGRGAYGVVETMKHEPSGAIFAVKRIHVSLNEDERKRMRNEIKASKESGRCPFMVLFYGAMLREGDVWICMEVMDTSLSQLLNMATDIDIQLPENILGKIAYSILKGLLFMKEELSLMHRDVKPSNVLLSRNGQIKICDFGISGHLTNSVAKTIQAGCKPYMAPERINPQTADGTLSGYDVRSDVWSIGITMVELASGKHPYDHWKTPFEQLKQVVENDPPKLPDDRDFSDEFRDFVSLCLRKEYSKRPKFKQLLAHPFIERCSAVPEEEVAQFACHILDTFESRQREISDSVTDAMLHRGISSLSLISSRIETPEEGQSPESERRPRSGSNMSAGNNSLTRSSAGRTRDGTGAGMMGGLADDSTGAAFAVDACSTSSVSGCSSAESTGLSGKGPFQPAS